jgi:hypothetical protein
MSPEARARQFRMYTMKAQLILPIARAAADSKSHRFWQAALTARIDPWFCDHRRRSNCDDSLVVSSQEPVGRQSLNFLLYCKQDRLPECFTLPSTWPGQFTRVIVRILQVIVTVGELLVVSGSRSCRLRCAPQFVSRHRLPSASTGGHQWKVLRCHRGQLETHR